MDTLADGFRILKGFATEMFVKRAWSMQDKQSACSQKEIPFITIVIYMYKEVPKNDH